MTIITGCTQTETKEKATISIQYPNAQIFYDKYGREIEKYLPHLQINIIESREGQEGDVLFLNSTETYFDYVANQWLYPLNEFIYDDGEFTKDLDPFVIDQLSVVDGNMYGLPPRIQSSAVYYNVDLFEQYGVPLPENFMTWEDLLFLSRQFETTKEHDDRETIYGLATPFFRDVPVLLIKRICSNYGIDVTDASALKIWEDVISTYQKGVIYDPEIEQGESIWQDDIFLTGRAALGIASQVMAYLLRDQNEESPEARINWGVVTVPSNPENPYSEDYRIHDIFGINMKSDHKEAAWEFIKYITGKPLQN